MPNPLARLAAALKPVPSRLRNAAWDIVLSAVAAAIAWVIAQRWLGHDLPVFAPISAVVSLAPGLPSHGKQAVGLMAGMAIGIVLGELSWLLNPEAANPVLWLVQMVASVIVAMLVASGLGLTAVVPIQAGVSVLLVLATGPQSAGLHRLVDGGVGVLVGLAFSQLLATPDPMRTLRTAMQTFLNRLAQGLLLAARAADEGDPAHASAAERTIASAWSDLRSLQDATGQSRASARWSLRGRLVAGPLLKVIARQNRHIVHLFAHVLMFAEALYSAIRSGVPAPAGLADRIRLCALHCRVILDPPQAESPPAQVEVAAAVPPWAEVLAQLDQVEDHLSQLVDLRRRAGLFVAGTAVGHSDPDPDAGLPQQKGDP